MSKRKVTPRVSIGLPIYNGEDYLEETLNSIISQKFTDFELIISDNASTDNTSKICQEYAQMDNRIIYYKSKKNRGAAWNFNQVFKKSSGYYFKWCAHDDLHHSEHLLKCVNVLDKDPSIIMCYTKIGVINEYGEQMGTYDYSTKLDSYQPENRFREILQKRPFFAIFGVIKRTVLEQTSLLAGYIGSDWNLLGELSLIGRIFEIPEFLFFRREHAKAYTNVYYSKNIKIHDHGTESLWWTGSVKPPLITLPCWKNCYEFFKSVNRSSLNFSEKLLCYNEIGKWLTRGRGGKMLYLDLKNEYNLFRLKLNHNNLQ